MFHVSMLRKYLRDLEHEIVLEPLSLKQDLTFESRPVRILEESEKVLRHRSIKYVKVLWTHQSEQEATWELESRIRVPGVVLYGYELELLFMCSCFRLLFCVDY